MLHPVLLKQLALHALSWASSNLHPVMNTKMISRENRVDTSTCILYIYIYVCVCVYDMRVHVSEISI